MWHHSTLLYIGLTQICMIFTGILYCVVYYRVWLFSLHTVPLYVLEQAPLAVPVMVSLLLGPTVLERAIESSGLTSM